MCIAGICIALLEEACGLVYANILLLLDSHCSFWL